MQIPEITQDPAVTAVLCVWFAVFGSCIGSFLNVAVYRLPAGKSLLYPPSHCPQCRHPIRWFDNVPVFGWLWLKGKCRDCRKPISVRYPLTEALCGVLSGSVFLFCNWFFAGQSVSVPVLAAVIIETAATLSFIVWLMYQKKRRR
ncbi:MAG: prepilin peptidase [Planctomycetaceae bacterium]|jgi:leader peptidase (prepilin peptidase)/N-methyltransferase|nr:prepilin peptidase [Planctomycetaceae bacterium]